MRRIIEKIVSNAIETALENGELILAAVPDPAVERPRDAGHGDWATAVALRIAKEAGKSPRAIAQIIASHIEESDAIDAVEIAGPGFINLRLSNAALQSIVRTAREQGAGFGRSDAGAGRSVNVEFVSANPTGPMHVGHGRWAALGNALCNVLDHAGWQVRREFYINDAGSQMDAFAQSVSIRYLQLCGKDVVLPEKSYGGAYVIDIAQTILDDEGAVWAETSDVKREAHFKEVAYMQTLDHVKEVLQSVGITFDVWFSERSLYEEGSDGKNAIDRTIEKLREGGYLYEQDGALWFKTSDFGDDKDRVLVKADGGYTYFAPDIAYHMSKFARGATNLIDVLGADHHGYVVRIDAACAALGYPGKLDVVLGQMVNLFRNGEAVRMSKRTGEMITFEELIEEVGGDATKYLMLARSTDQPIDFDIEVAKTQDSSNPVYYVQYAHARICSLLKKADRAIADDTDLSVLVEPSELALARKLSEMGEIVEGCARDRAPFRLTHYAEDLASTFHQFYTLCQVITDDEALSAARLYLADATRSVLKCVLALLGVSAPERM